MKCVRRLFLSTLARLLNRQSQPLELLRRRIIGLHQFSAMRAESLASSATLTIGLSCPESVSKSNSIV